MAMDIVTTATHIRMKNNITPRIARINLSGFNQFNYSCQIKFLSAHLIKYIFNSERIHDASR